MTNAEIEAAREAVRAKISGYWEAMVEAAIAQALGLKFILLRDRKNGKFLGRVRTEKQLDDALKDKRLELVEVWGQSPNMTAFQSLMDRFIDRAKEQEVTIVNKDAERIVQRLHAGRARVAEAAKHGMRLVPGGQGDA